MAYNTVLTTVGIQWIIDKIGEVVATNPDYIGWGTGADEADITDTTLSTESAEDRVQGAMTQPSADKLRVIATLTSASGQTITNAGSFDGQAGVLIVFGNFAGVALLTGDKIEFTVDLQMT